MIAVSDYSGANFPDWLFGRTGSGVNGTQNCTACHLGTVPADGEEWNLTHTVFTCGSCHVGDTLAEAYPSLVGSGPHGDIDVHNCADCHGTWTADTYHGISPRLEALDTARSYQMEIVSVENAAAGLPAQVTWRVQKDSIYQNLFTGADTYLQDAVRLGIGWGYGDDWVNDGSGVVSNGDAGRPFQVTANAGNTVQGIDNTYAVTTFPNLPMAAEADRNGFAVVERGPQGVNVSSALKTFTLGSGAAELGDRREIVSTESCLGCHTTIGRHGTYADTAAGVTSCVSCHNAGSLSRDGSVVQGTVDFMYIMHAIHGVGEKRSKFDRRRDHGYDYVTYPNTVTDCTACHIGDSHKEVDYGKRLGVIANEGKDLFLDGKGANSPYASVCYSCHQDDKETYRAHFLSMSANMLGNASFKEYFEGGRAETCNLCHW